MRRWLRALLKLRSPGDALLALEVFAFAAIVPLLAQVRLDRLRRLLTPPVPRGPANPDLIDRIIRCVDGVRALGKPVVGQSCLTRGLTLYYFLRRAGLDVALCFGVDYEEGGLAGHCWLVRDGEPFLEPGPPPRRYTEMYRFPSGHPGATMRPGPAPESLRG